MIVTGAFLADFARACDQKLDAIGAVRDNYTFPAGEALEAKLSVVSLLQSERLLTDSGRVKLQGRGPSGAVFTEVEAYHMIEAGKENGFIIFDLQVSFEGLGRYLFELGIGDQTPLVISFEVRQTA